jgi:hypothetical protein
MMSYQLTIIKIFSFVYLTCNKDTAESDKFAAYVLFSEVPAYSNLIVVQPLVFIEVYVYRMHSSICKRWIYDVLSINYRQFHAYVDLIYSKELEIKNTSKSSTSASYVDILLKMDTESKLSWCLYLAGDLVSKSMFNMRSILKFEAVLFTGKFLNFYGRYEDFVCHYNLILRQILSFIHISKSIRR